VFNCSVKRFILALAIYHKGARTSFIHLVY